MRLLDRYLFRELLVPLGFCLSGFFVFWIFSNLFTELGDFQKKKLLLIDIAEYYLAGAPSFFGIVLPLGLLLAMLYALTNHSRHNELTAMRAAGLSLWRIALPYFLVGLAASLFLFALNEIIAPDSEDNAEAILKRRLPPAPGAPAKNQVRNLGFTNARAGRIWQIGLYNVDTGEMISPKVIWTIDDGSTRWLMAERAERENGEWTFYNVREYLESPEANNMPVPFLQTNHLTLPEFTETPEEIRSEIKLAGSISLTQARKADIPLKTIIDYLHFHPRLTRSDHAWLYTRLHGRLAAPWTCLVVVLIALPFGAAAGRRNVFYGVSGCLLIAFLYFVLQQLSLAVGTGSYVPPWLAAWFPNFAFALVGLAMIFRHR